MKNTSRIHKKNTTSQAPVKPADGHSDAKSGHVHGQDKSTEPAHVLGRALQLTTKETEALGLIASWKKLNPYDFCQGAVVARLNASYDDMRALAKDDKKPAEKEWALKFLAAVEPLFPQVQEDSKPPASKPECTRRHVSMCDIEFAIRDSNALLQLLFHSLDHEGVEIFRNQNGYLAAGVQSLMWHAQRQLTNAFYVNGELEEP